MQTGGTTVSVSVVFLWLVISAALEQTVEGNTTASEKPIRQSQTLCAGEQEYVDQRKQKVLESLSNLGINCSADSVPHIAMLGSGGGERAAVSMVGSLYQMEEEGLLDTVLYLGGVSGSTWAMASIYSDPEWSNNMSRAVSTLLGPGVKQEEVLAWLKERSVEDDFSLTDVWAVLTAAGIMKHMCLRRLSDEASRNATNPYPIYSAIEKGCYKEGPVEGKWFEVTPHEAGFTELDLFVETSLLGSTFQGGELLKKRPEMDMVKLQGDLGSALADGEKVQEYIPPGLNVPGVVVGAVEYMLAHSALDRFIVLTKLIFNDPGSVMKLANLQKAREDMFNPDGSEWNENRNLSVLWRGDLVKGIKSWHENLEDGPFKTQVSQLIDKVVPLIMKWEWGTTGNFLYQYQDPTVPPCLNSNETFYLVDAGLLINVPFPPFLGDKRDIDLIITTEFSAGDMFESLNETRKYAAELNKKFPEIGEDLLEDRDWPKDCYVFEGKELSIVYMPLFNRRNCKDAEEVKAKMEEFSTFQRPFSQQQTDVLLETAKNNIKNNKEILLREIDKAVLRRQHKRKQREEDGSMSSADL